jgi:hypothetical protein
MERISVNRPIAQRNTKNRGKTVMNKMKPGKLQPIFMQSFKAGEGGVVSFNLNIELEPIQGRCITPINAELFAVCVPVEAMVALKYPDDEYAGLREIIADKMANRQPIFDLGDGETEISQSCRINPIRVGNQLRVTDEPRLAHACAVNFLRRRVYYKASQIDAGDYTITPAIIRETVLQRYNGVLDPDDRINGRIDFQLPTIVMPVEGVGAEMTPTFGQTPQGVMEADGVASQFQDAKNFNSTTAGTRVYLKMKADGVTPDITATLNGVSAGSVSSTDFYQAKEMDRLVRAMDEIVQQYPQHGQEMILRWVAGLSINNGNVPWSLGDRYWSLNRTTSAATDAVGVNQDVMRTDYAGVVSMRLPVPPSELGCCVVVFLTIKPEEVVKDQPDPDFTQTITGRNHAAEMMDIDPKSVLLRQMDVNVPTGLETQIAFWTALSALDQSYTDYGLARNLPENSVTNRTLFWNYYLPLSVTPDNVVYPASILAYPFVDQTGDICTYTVSYQSIISTMQQFGPAPVEDINIADGILADV